MSHEPESYSEITDKVERDWDAKSDKVDDAKQDEETLCPECGGDGLEPMSDCCGAKVDTDMMLCHECHDHCELATCETCGK